MPEMDDTSHIQNFSSMFQRTKISSCPLLDTSSATNMAGMFYQCTNLTSIPNFNITNVTNLSNFTYGCYNLTTVPLLDTRNVTTVSQMFLNCNRLSNIPNFNLINTTSAGGMIWGTAITSLPDFVFSNKLTDLSSFCNQCGQLNIANITYNITNVTSYERMFQSCGSLTTVDFSDAILENDTHPNNIKANYMFYYCRNLTKIDLRIFDLNKFTGYSSMFTSVPTSCLIIVKDDDSKTWMNTKFSSYTNVKTAAEYEAEQ